MSPLVSLCAVTRLICACIVLFVLIVHWFSEVLTTFTPEIKLKTICLKTTMVKTELLHCLNPSKKNLWLMISFVQSQFLSAIFYHSSSWYYTDTYAIIVLFVVPEDSRDSFLAGPHKLRQKPNLLGITVLACTTDTDFILRTTMHHIFWFSSWCICKSSLLVLKPVGNM